MDWSKNVKKVSRKKQTAQREKQILSLILENQMNLGEIAEFVGLKSKQQVINIRNKLVEDGKLVKHEGSFVGQAKKTKSARWEDVENSEFTQIESVQKWWQSIKNRLSNPADQVRQLLIICQTLEIHPDQILNAVDDMGQPNHLNKATECMEKFKEHIDNNTVKYVSKQVSDTVRKKNKSGEAIRITGYNVALASYMSFHGKPIPRGYGGASHILSRKKVKYGTYSHIQLNDKQIERLYSFMYKEFGYLYQIMAMFMIETMGRPTACLKWSCNYAVKKIEYMGKQYEYIELKLYENKQKTTYTKRVIDPKCITEFKKLEKGKPIVSDKDIYDLVNAFKRFYISEGLLHPNTILPITDPEYHSYDLGTDEYYLSVKPSYTVRHSGAHKWMRRTGYRADIVAEMGWEDTSTLTSAYASLPSEYLFTSGQCFFCNPPQDRDLDNMTFCSGLHSLVYLQNGNKTMKEMKEEGNHE